ncbi:NUDIX domain-containing protein [Streptomyces sp. NPDC020707]|uniref:NUDIX domain-containing protein n=1 Tax=Streptomyces sp. NPDC020707 TaxID=3365084 RepID=UPI003792F1D5
MPSTNNACGAVAIITNSAGELLLHLRDNFPGIAWPGHWSLLGGATDPGEDPSGTIVRELREEASIAVETITELFEVRDENGSGSMITFFAARWEGDETLLPLTEGVELRYFEPRHLPTPIPPYIRDAIHRYLTDTSI